VPPRERHSRRPCGEGKGTYRQMDLM
jgi:hypothetical protein